MPVLEALELTGPYLASGWAHFKRYTHFRRGMRLFAVTSTSCAANRTSTSPSTHRITSLLVRSITRAGARPSGSALVLSVVRVLLWMRSGSWAAGRAWGVFMTGQSGRAHPQAPARRAACSCTRRKRLHGGATWRTPSQGAAT